MANNDGLVEIASSETYKKVQELIENLKKIAAEITNINRNLNNSRLPSDNANNLNQITQQNQRLNTVRERANQLSAAEIVNQRTLRQNADQYARSVSVLGGAYQRLSAQQAISARNLQNLIAGGRRAEQTQRQYNRELRNAQREFDSLNRRVLAADRAVGRFNRNVGNYPMQAARGLKDLIGAFGILGGTALIASIAKDIFNTTRELQSMNFALTQVIGNVGQVASTQQFLSRISEAYGIELIGLTQSYTAFYAASKNAIDSGAITAQQIQNIFESVSKASGAMGLSVEQQKGAFLALQQMISKGTVQAEEIRGQLAERLPGAFGILAKSMNVTEQQLNKMLKDGKVLAAEVLPAFAKELEKAYGVENLERVETLNAETTRLKNTWTELIKTLNEGDGAFAKFLSGSISAIGDSIEGFRRLIQSKESADKEFQSRGFSKGFKDETTQLNISAEEFKEISKRVYKTQEEFKKNYDEYRKSFALSEQEGISALRNSALSEYNRLVKRNAYLKSVAGLAQDSEGNKLDLFGKNGAQARADEQIANTKAIQGLNYQVGIREGQLKAISKFLDELNPKEKADTEEKKKKVKLQKDEIDYQAKIYELRKLNSEVLSNNDKRVMEDEEQNFKDRAEAMENYYFGLNTQAKMAFEEENRLNKLKLKNDIKRYEYSVEKGTDQFQDLSQLQNQFLIEQNIIKARYEDRSNQLTIEKAKALQGVLMSITDQSQKNIISQRSIEDLRQVGLYLKNISGNTTLKQFADLENKLNDIANSEEERKNQSLRIDLATNLANQERIKSQLSSSKTIAKDNEALNELKNEELNLQQQLIESDNKRAESVKEVYQQMAEATNEYLSSIGQSFLSDSGFSSLGKFFDQTTYQVVNAMGEIETRTGSTFQKLWDQAETTEQKFAVAFSAIGDIAKDTLAFMNQNQTAYFDAQYARLEKEKDLAIEFAGESSTAKAEIERQYEERRREIDRRKAKAQKETAIFNAIINTAQAVTAFLAEANYAGAILAGVLGAAQIAMISSQQVPEYAMGTDNHAGGLAIVGDGGKNEIVYQPSKGFSVTPKTDTLVDLEKGSKVFPDFNSFLKNSGAMLGGVPNIELESNGLSKDDMDGIMGKYFSDLSTNNFTFDKNGFEASITKRNSRVKLMNSQVRGKGLTFKN